MKTLILATACILASVFANAMSPATASSAANEMTASPFTAAHINALPAQEKKAVDATILKRLALNLDKTGTTFLIGRCEKMTYYVPATGCRIAPSVFSFQLRTRTEHIQWACKVSTPILSSALPSAIFSVQLTF